MKSNLLKGAIWLASAKAIVNCLTFASTIILARLLLPEDFGLVSFALSIFAVVSAVTELSLAPALINVKDIKNEHFDTVWTMNAIRGLIVSALFYLCSSVIALEYGDARLELILKIYSAVLLISSFSNPKVIIFAKNLQFKQEFIINVTQKFFGFIVGIALAYFYHTYWALIISGLIHQIVGVLISYLLVSYRPSISFKYVKELFGFSFWLTLCQAVLSINMKFDQFFIGTKLGSKDLGYYTVGDNLSTMPIRELVAPIESTLYPAFSIISSDKQRLKNAYIRAQNLITFICLPLGLCISLLSDELVFFFMGINWINAVVVIKIMAVMVAIQTLTSPANQLAMSQGLTRSVFYRDLMTLVLRVPLIIAGFFLLGIQGILYARVVSISFTTFLNMLLVKKILNISVLRQLDSNMRTIASALVMSVVILIFKHSIDVPNTSLLTFGFLFCGFLICAITYLLTSFYLQKVSRSIESPEKELIEIFFKLKAKFIKVRTNE